MVYPPSLISRKFARRGVTVPVLMVRRDPDTPSHHTMQARARTGADGMKRESRLPYAEHRVKGCRFKRRYTIFGRSRKWSACRKEPQAWRADALGLGASPTSAVHGVDSHVHCLPLAKRAVKRVLEGLFSLHAFAGVLAASKSSEGKLSTGLRKTRLRRFCEVVFLGSPQKKRTPRGSPLSYRLRSCCPTQSP